MGTDESSQKKISTQDLFGDILGEVESAWENRKQGGAKAQSSSLSIDQTAGDAERQTRAARDSSQIDSGGLHQPDLPPDHQTTEPPDHQPGDSPAIEPFAPPAPAAGSSGNGHVSGQAPSALASEAAPGPSTDELSTAELPKPEATESRPTQSTPQASTAGASAPQTSAPAASAPLPFARLTPDVGDSAEATEGGQDTTAVLPLQSVEPPRPADPEVGTPYMPWMEEANSTNWARLAWMAAVVGIVGVGVWWFALRPTDGAVESDTPQVVTEPAESFIAGIEGDAETRGSTQGPAGEAIAVEDAVTAVVEPVPEELAGEPQSAGTQSGGENAAAAAPVAVSQGPTQEQLEAMIASRVAAQERRLRAELDAQRLALEEKIANIERANAAAVEGSQTGSTEESSTEEPVSEPASEEAGTAAAGQEGDGAVDEETGSSAEAD